MEIYQITHMQAPLIFSIVRPHLHRDPLTREPTSSWAPLIPLRHFVLADVGRVQRRFGVIQPNYSASMGHLLKVGIYYANHI